MTAALDRLRSAELRATLPRIAVLTVLDLAREAREHLTAGDVHARVARRLGSVSVQAVYDCLDVLERADLVRRIQPAGMPAHFESRVGDNHHHVVCRSCGRTEDVDCVTGEAPCVHPASAGGFVVEQADITFWGVCPDCVATVDAPDRGAAAPPPGVGAPSPGVAVPPPGAAAPPPGPAVTPRRTYAAPHPRVAAPTRGTSA